MHVSSLFMANIRVRCRVEFYRLCAAGSPVSTGEMIALPAEIAGEPRHWTKLYMKKSEGTQNMRDYDISLKRRSMGSFYGKDGDVSLNIAPMDDDLLVGIWCEGNIEYLIKIYLDE